MLCLILLVAILAVLARGDDSCTPKYYIVNTFKTDISFSFSCYGIGADCDISYAPPGNGCNGDSVALIGTVPENETQVLTPGMDLEVGGGFCSDYKIAVSSILDSFHIVATLPRATEAGTYFNMALESYSDAAVYQCSLSALSFPAQVSLVKDGIENSFSVDPYGLYQFIFDLNTSSRNLMKVVSDKPVIISCLGDGTPNRLVTLQPISSERLLVTTWGNSIVSMVLSDCSTNELVTDFSKVKLDSIQENGQPCEPVQVKSNDDSQMYFFESICAVLITPSDDVCVSVTRQSNNFYMTDVGIPEAKFSTRFLHYDLQHSYYLFSFSETPCTSYKSPTSTGTIFNKEWMKGSLDGILAYDFVPEPLNDFSWTECVEPTFLAIRQLNTRIPYLVGIQSDELWQPFLDSECPEAPTDSPSEPPVSPSEPPVSPSEPTKAPSSSGARSLVASWVVFSGLNLAIFSASLV